MYQDMWRPCTVVVLLILQTLLIFYVFVSIVNGIIALLFNHSEWPTFNFSQ